MMTLENYEKMKAYNVALAESFHKAEIAAEILEILSENEGEGMTAKEISEKFNAKFKSHYHKEEIDKMTYRKFDYYHITRWSVAQFLRKLVNMNKVKQIKIITYPVNISPEGYTPEYITGETKVYGV